MSDPPPSEHPSKIVSNPTGEEAEPTEGPADEPSPEIESAPETIEEPTVEIESAPETIEEPTAEIESAPETIEEPTAEIESAPETTEEPTAEIESTPETIEEPTAEIESAPETTEEPTAEIESTPETIEEPTAEIETAPETNGEPIAEIESAPETSEEPTAEMPAPETIEQPSAEIEPAPETIQSPPVEIESHAVLSGGDSFFEIPNQEETLEIMDQVYDDHLETDNFPINNDVVPGVNDIPEPVPVAGISGGNLATAVPSIAEAPSTKVSSVPTDIPDESPEATVSTKPTSISFGPADKIPPIDVPWFRFDDEIVADADISTAHLQVEGSVKPSAGPSEAKVSIAELTEEEIPNEEEVVTESETEVQNVEPPIADDDLKNSKSFRGIHVPIPQEELSELGVGVRTPTESQPSQKQLEIETQEPEMAPVIGSLLRFMSSSAMVDFLVERDNLCDKHQCDDSSDGTEGQGPSSGCVNGVPPGAEDVGGDIASNMAAIVDTALMGVATVMTQLASIDDLGPYNAFERLTNYFTLRPTKSEGAHLTARDVQGVTKSTAAILTGADGSEQDFAGARRSRSVPLMQETNFFHAMGYQDMGEDSAREILMHVPLHWSATNVPGQAAIVQAIQSQGGLVQGLLDGARAVHSIISQSQLAQGPSTVMNAIQSSKQLLESGIGIVQAVSSHASLVQGILEGAKAVHSLISHTQLSQGPSHLPEALLALGGPSETVLSAIQQSQQLLNDASNLIGHVTAVGSNVLLNMSPSVQLVFQDDKLYQANLRGAKGGKALPGNLYAPASSVTSEVGVVKQQSATENLDDGDDRSYQGNVRGKKPGSLVPDNLYGPVSIQSSEFTTATGSRNPVGGAQSIANADVQSKTPVNASLNAGLGKEGSHKSNMKGLQQSGVEVSASQVSAKSVKSHPSRTQSKNSVTFKDAEDIESLASARDKKPTSRRTSSLKPDSRRKSHSGSILLRNEELDPQNAMSPVEPGGTAQPSQGALAPESDLAPTVSKKSVGNAGGTSSAQSATKQSVAPSNAQSAIKQSVAPSNAQSATKQSTAPSNAQSEIKQSVASSNAQSATKQSTAPSNAQSAIKQSVASSNAQSVTKQSMAQSNAQSATKQSMAPGNDQSQSGLVGSESKISTREQETPASVTNSQNVSSIPAGPSESSAHPMPLNGSAVNNTAASRTSLGAPSSRKSVVVNLTPEIRKSLAGQASTAEQAPSEKTSRKSLTSNASGAPEPHQSKSHSGSIRSEHASQQRSLNPDEGGPTSSKSRQQPPGDGSGSSEGPTNPTVLTMTTPAHEFETIPGADNYKQSLGGVINIQTNAKPEAGGITKALPSVLGSTSPTAHEERRRHPSLSSMTYHFSPVYQNKAIPDADLEPNPSNFPTDFVLPTSTVPTPVLTPDISEHDGFLTRIPFSGRVNHYDYMGQPNSENTNATATAIKSPPPINALEQDPSSGLLEPRETTSSPFLVTNPQDVDGIEILPANTYAAAITALNAEFSNGPGYFTESTRKISRDEEQQTQNMQPRADHANRPDNFDFAPPTFNTLPNSSHFSNNADAEALRPYLMNSWNPVQGDSSSSSRQHGHGTQQGNTSIQIPVVEPFFSQAGGNSSTKRRDDFGLKVSPLKLDELVQTPSEFLLFEAHQRHQNLQLRSPIVNDFSGTDLPVLNSRQDQPRNSEFQSNEPATMSSRSNFLQDDQPTAPVYDSMGFPIQKDPPMNRNDGENRNVSPNQTAQEVQKKALEDAEIAIRRRNYDSFGTMLFDESGPVSFIVRGNRLSTDAPAVAKPPSQIAEDRPMTPDLDREFQDILPAHHAQTSQTAPTGKPENVPDKAVTYQMLGRKASGSRSNKGLETPPKAVSGSGNPDLREGNQNPPTATATGGSNYGLSHLDRTNSKVYFNPLVQVEKIPALSSPTVSNARLHDGEGIESGVRSGQVNETGFGPSDGFDGGNSYPQQNLAGFNPGRGNDAGFGPGSRNDDGIAPGGGGRENEAGIGYPPGNATGIRSPSGNEDRFAPVVQGSQAGLLPGRRYDSGIGSDYGHGAGLGSVEGFRSPDGLKSGTEHPRANDDGFGPGSGYPRGYETGSGYPQGNGGGVEYPRVNAGGIVSPGGNEAGSGYPRGNETGAGFPRGNDGGVEYPRGNDGGVEYPRVNAGGIVSPRGNESGRGYPRGNDGGIAFPQMNDVRSGYPGGIDGGIRLPRGNEVGFGTGPVSEAGIGSGLGSDAGFPTQNYLGQTQNPNEINTNAGYPRNNESFQSNYPTSNDSTPGSNREYQGQGKLPSEYKPPISNETGAAADPSRNTPEYESRPEPEPRSSGNHSDATDEMIFSYSEEQIPLKEWEKYPTGPNKPTRDEDVKFSCTLTEISNNDGNEPQVELEVDGERISLDEPGASTIVHEQVNVIRKGEESFTIVADKFKGLKKSTDKKPGTSLTSTSRNALGKQGSRNAVQQPNSKVGIRNVPSASKPIPILTLTNAGNPKPPPPRVNSIANNPRPSTSRINKPADQSGKKKPTDNRPKWK